MADNPRQKFYAGIASLFGRFPHECAMDARIWRIHDDVAMCNIAICRHVAYVHRFVRVDRPVLQMPPLFAITHNGFLNTGDRQSHNFVTPYSHEATHGLALSMMVLLMVHQAIATQRVG